VCDMQDGDLPSAGTVFKNIGLDGNEVSPSRISSFREMHSAYTGTACHQMRFGLDQIGPHGLPGVCEGWSMVCGGDFMRRGQARGREGKVQNRGSS
jgi:hypothetical protein